VHSKTSVKLNLKKNEPPTKHFYLELIVGAAPVVYSPHYIHDIQEVWHYLRFIRLKNLGANIYVYGSAQ
jgi:hypothetical protein